MALPVHLFPSWKKVLLNHPNITCSSTWHNMFVKQLLSAKSQLPYFTSNTQISVKSRHQQYNNHKIFSQWTLFCTKIDNASFRDFFSYFICAQSAKSKQKSTTACYSNEKRRLPEPSQDAPIQTNILFKGRTITIRKSQPPSGWFQTFTTWEKVLICKQKNGQCEKKGRKCHANSIFQCTNKILKSCK